MRLHLRMFEFYWQFIGNIQHDSRAVMYDGCYDDEDVVFKNRFKINWRQPKAALLYGGNRGNTINCVQAIEQIKIKCNTHWMTIRLELHREGWGRQRQRCLLVKCNSFISFTGCVILIPYGTNITIWVQDKWWTHRTS